MIQMVNALFLKIVAMSLTAGIVILVVLLVRLLVKTAEKVCVCALVCRGISAGRSGHCQFEYQHLSYGYSWEYR